jgi:predicted DNA-binding transcriptional regulator AlpA
MRGILYLEYLEHAEEPDQPWSTDSTCGGQLYGPSAKEWKRRTRRNKESEKMQMEYEFTLKFMLPDNSGDASLHLQALGEAGCDDALIGVGQPGRVALNFTREAASAEQAIVSALSDVKQAIPAAKLVEAGPDFVGLTDVADLAGVSRQNMRKLMVGHPSSFPAPVHEGSASVWHLANILLWLRDNKNYRFEDRVIDVAQAAMQVNLAKEAIGLLPRMRKEVRSLVA